MPFTVEEFRDLVRVLKERPEWREELRRLVLTDELLALPEQIARLWRETDQRFQDLATQVSRLVEAQRRSEERMGRLEETVGQLAEAQRRMTDQVSELVRAMHTLSNDVGGLKGESLENRYRTKAYAYFGPLLRRAHALSQDELAALLEEAIESSTLAAAEAQDVALADVVVRGKRREDGAEVYLVVEVSWGVGHEDVTRAVRRAALFARTGVTTIPVVAGQWVTADAAQLARADKVWQLTDGHAVLPESAAAP